MTGTPSSEAPQVPDAIVIRGMELPVQIGVPDEERQGWQTLRADLELELDARVEIMADEIDATVDYDRVTRHVRALAAARPRRLIETLAGEIAAAILGAFPVKRVTVTLRKRILPAVDDVGVRITRSASAP
ncbi:MAG: dihydroneopterin aldolase [Anaerolineae bacterium]|jgi:dihydroneopterin aldolase|nr:dihydroneopterin aldolase [Anaerolineae bacterium]